MNIHELAEAELLFEAAHRHTSEETKTRQQNKFERLVSKDSGNASPSPYEINTDRWVVNLSDRPISDDERSILSKGLNFAVTPTSIPIAEIIAGTEVVAKHLSNSDADELRCEVVRTIKRAKLPKSNITKNERTALQQLQKDDTKTPPTSIRTNLSVLSGGGKGKNKSLTICTGDYTQTQRSPQNSMALLRSTKPTTR